MKIAILYHNQLKNYDLGEGHPFRGDRFEIFLNFFKKRFKKFEDRFNLIQPSLATDKDLELVHEKDYIQFVKESSEGRWHSHIFRYVSKDNIDPSTGNIPQGIDKATRIIVDSSILGAELVIKEKFKKAIGIGGGLHHAKPNFGEGFCFYNDVAISVRYLQKKYKLKRILILDTDAHAGNGTEEIFYSDPEVLFIDLHQDPRTIYPGTGFITEIGDKKGKGFTVNLPLLPGSGYESYHYIFEEVIIPLAREFQPELIIRYGGSDPHYLDELTNLGLNLKGFKMIGKMFNLMAEELCEGKSIEFLVSGYNLKVLPFAWSALISGSLGLDVELSDFQEDPLLKDYNFLETKNMVSELKNLLKRYWRCMEK